MYARIAEESDGCSGGVLVVDWCLQERVQKKRFEALEKAKREERILRTRVRRGGDDVPRLLVGPRRRYMLTGGDGLCVG